LGKQIIKLKYRRLKMVTLNQVFDNSKNNRGTKTKNSNNFFSESLNNLENINLQKFDLVKGDAKSKIKELRHDLPEDNLERIHKLIDEIKGSNNIITEASKQCIDFIQLAEKGIDEVNEKSGFFNRIWGAITGSNQKSHIKTEQNLANAQRAAVQIINEMNKQMLLTQEQILMLENLIQYMVREEKEFRQELKNSLNNIFAAVKKRFELIEKTIYDLAVQGKSTREILDQVIKVFGNEIDNLWNQWEYLQKYILKVERQVETLEWVQLIEAYDNEYDQWKFEETKILLFFKTVFEFYDNKRGNFTYKDLLLLSTVLRKLGFVPEESFTLEDFINKYVEEFYPNYFEEVTNFLVLDTDQKVIKRIIKDGYFAVSSDKTQFITTLNIVNHIMGYNAMNSDITPDDQNNISEIILKNIKSFNKNNVLRLDASIDWFLMACELLSYKRMKPSSYQSNESDFDKRIIDIIEKGKEGNDKVLTDINELFLNELVLKVKNIITTDLNKSLIKKNYSKIKEFTDANSDPITFIQYAQNINLNQFEIDLNEDSCIGIYVGTQSNKLLISTLISFDRDSSKDFKSHFIDSGFEKVNLHPRYNSYGKVIELSGAEENIKQKLNSISEIFLNILNVLIKK